MTGIPVQIFSGATPIAVSGLGQLLVAPFDYDEVVAITLNANNTAFNFYKPKAHMRFVITGILLTASSGVVQSALIDVYEGTSATDIVIEKSILHVEILKNDFRDITPMNVVVREGKWLNAKTDDNNIFITITGYYIPVTSAD